MGKLIVFLIIASIILRIVGISVPFIKFIATGCWAAALILVLMWVFYKMFLD